MRNGWGVKELVDVGCFVIWGFVREVFVFFLREKGSRKFLWEGLGLV